MEKPNVHRLHTLLQSSQDRSARAQTSELVLSDFYDNLFRGNIFKELVKILFEKSEYMVISYGYENSFSSVKKKIATKDSPTARRIRSSPDLLIYDDQIEDVKLVEVKMSSNPDPWFKRDLIETYKRFWNDAILVLVWPYGNVFYAQEISKLGIKKQYDPKTDFEKMQEIFTRINSDVIKNYGAVACNLIAAIKSRPIEIEDHQ